MANKVRKILMITSLTVLIIAIGNWGYAENILGFQDYATRRAMAIRFKDVSEAQLTIDKRSRVINKLMLQTQPGLKKQGFIAIPQEGILLPIFNDAYSTKGLNAGANYANRSGVDPNGDRIPVMGQGNYGLAGHNFSDGITAFSRLQKKINRNDPYLANGKANGSNWLNGQKIYLANQNGIYVYTVISQKTVEKNDTSILNPTQKPQVTILTCLNPNDNYRIATIGELIKRYSWKQAPYQVVGYFDLFQQKTNAHAQWYNPGDEEGIN